MLSVVMYNHTHAGRAGLCYARLMSDFDDQDFRGWRFDAVSREAQLERRVKELETTVARLEREIRTKQMHEYDKAPPRPNSIGSIAGTISTQVLPEAPYKAD